MNQLEYIKKHKDIHSPKLMINAMFACRLSSFEIIQREINAEHITFVDCDNP